MPCHVHAALCCGLEKSLSEWHGHGMALARCGIWELNMVALCKSNGKDSLNPKWNGWAWQGNSVGTAWEWHGMCELALTSQGFYSME
jgi:hypothetical protein